jgi:hypothetical protein
VFFHRKKKYFKLPKYIYYLISKYETAGWEINENYIAIHGSESGNIYMMKFVKSHKFDYQFISKMIHYGYYNTFWVYITKNTSTYIGSAEQLLYRYLNHENYDERYVGNIICECQYLIPTIKLCCRENNLNALKRIPKWYLMRDLNYYTKSVLKSTGHIRIKLYIIYVYLSQNLKMYFDC